MADIAMLRNVADEWPKDAPPGTYDIVENGLEGRPSVNARILFQCPNNRRCSVFLGPVFEARRHEDEPNVWEWNGNVDCPSVSPSINCVTEYKGKPTTGCGWHGFITDGVMR